MSPEGEGGASDLKSRAAALSAWLEPRRGEMVDLVTRLASAESPSHEPERQAAVFELLATELEPAGFTVRTLRGRTSGGQLFARPARAGRAGYQLLLGHVDTVWPAGTLATMPVRAEGGRLFGPGVFDMKGGLALAVFALAALAALDFEPELVPVLFLNSDEELGSPDSARRIRRLARQARRALVLEPAFGPEGRSKTERKGVGRFTVRAFGRSAHAGLAPETGASAIREIARAIERLAALDDPARGTTINVGVVAGGTRANVVAALARAEVDLRFADARAGAEAEREILSLAPTLPGVRIEISGGIERPPLVRTARNGELFARAVECARALGFDLGEAAVGGGSDGNFASPLTAT
ncbi:MAG TPA: M20/M25/M40 family metallo-hydrolase, partial [Thermoanaerobaculia bacterium]|nr:M20/M25/M40 family metallo-hydrolase [Thermoanaerobaculia bacterium]